MTNKSIRVLIVDDSPTTVAVLKKMLSSSEEIEVVATAANGVEGLRRLEESKPDVICTDLNMPEMDGLEFTRRVMQEHPRPIMVISTEVEDRQSQKVFDLLKAGAVEIFPKPRAGLSPQNDDLRRELIKKIKVLKGIVVFHKHRSAVERAAAAARVQPRPARPPEKPAVYRILGIGSSTGGPQALLSILPRLPAAFPLPVICVQHISAGFLRGLVDWLNEHCALEVRIAARGEKPAAGRVYFPPEGLHLEFARDGSFAESEAPPYHGHRPSVNVTFASIAARYGPDAIGVLLTGMGDDGAVGLAEMKAGGAFTIAQNEASSTVFGMPRAAIEIGAASEILALDEIAARVLELTAVGRG